MAGKFLYESSSGRPVPFRMRSDLVVAEHTYRSEPTWVLKDPLGLKYYRLNEQEYTLLEWTDGRVSLDDLRDRFNSRFSPYRVTTRELQTFLGDMYSKSLLTPLAPDRGRHLVDVRRETKRKELLQKITNIYAIQWRGVDPDRFLNAVGKYGTCLFGPTAAMINATIFVFALIVLWMHADRFAAETPSVEQFFSALFKGSNWLVMAVVISLTKLLHELGHAFQFKRFGGECHEIGVMIFFMTPTMYCNTSDSWLLKSKWQRAAIGLGGIYVELFVMSIAVFVWVLTDTGSVSHYAAMNLILVCSVSAVLMNGNPLVKYDGYFVLSDLLEIPNLQQRAGQAVEKLFNVHALGLKTDHDPTTPAPLKRFFVVYSIAAFAYRILLTTTVAFVMAGFLKPYGLEQAGLVIAILLLVMFVAKPFKAIYKRLSTPGALAMVNRTRAAITLGIACLAFALLFTPVPSSVICDFSIEAERATEVHSKSAGIIDEILVTPGEQVEAGDILLRLQDPNLVVQENQIRRTLAGLTAKRAALLAASDSEQQASLAEVERDLEKQEAMLEVIVEQLDSLVIRAPHSGVICSTSDRRPRSIVDNDSTVATWSGDLLQSANLGFSIGPMESVCVVADTQETQAVLGVPLQYAGLVTVGKDVVMLADGGSQRFHGKVVATSKSISESSELNETLSTRSASKLAKLAHGTEGPDDFAGQDDETAKLDAPLLQAMVEFDAPVKGAILYGAGGTARVSIGYRSLAWRIQGWLDRTLNFRF